MKQTKEVKPFGIKDKLGYMMGDFGNDFTFILSTMLLTKFYTDVMGVSAAVVGTIMMLARFVDAFTDVTMGRICDRSKVTPNGKFKPWILRMCVPVALASFLMYQSGLSGWLLTAIGYSSEAAAEGMVQTDSVLSGIYNISTLIPAVGFGLLAAVLWFWYPLRKKQVDANIELLKEKHNK